MSDYDSTHPLIVETPNVESVLANTAGSAVAIGHDKAVFLNFVADVAVHIKIGPSTVSAPVISAVAGATRCWRIPKDQISSIFITKDQTHFRIIGDGSATGFFRWYVEEKT